MSGLADRAELAVLTPGAGLPGLVVRAPAAVLGRLPIFLYGWSTGACGQSPPAVSCTEDEAGFAVSAPVLPRGRAGAADPFGAADLVASALAALAVRGAGVILPHAGAAESAAGLILLLADTTVGKSTLALTLAERGWRLFGDDRLALATSAAGSQGIALGLAPKVRLPLPRTADGLAAFVARRRSFASRDFAFLALAPEEQAPPGTRAAIGACVLLDRRGGAPELRPAPAPLLVRALAESAAAPWLNPAEVLALAVAHAALPAFHLSYGEATEAADLLARRFAVPPAAQRSPVRYRRRADVAITMVEEDGFLADPQSGEIFHLDSAARGLWTLLAEPMDADEIALVFRAAFPEARPEVLSEDLSRALKQLLDHRLVVSVP